MKIFLLFVYYVYARGRLCGKYPANNYGCGSGFCMFNGRHGYCVRCPSGSQNSRVGCLNLANSTRGYTKCITACIRPSEFENYI